METSILVNTEGLATIQGISRLFAYIPLFTGVFPVFIAYYPAQGWMGDNCNREPRQGRQI
jgi:hypothetical protein